MSSSSSDAIYCDSSLSAEDVRELEDFNASLYGEKIAAPASSTFGRVVRTAAEGTAAQLTAGAMGLAAVAGGKALYDKATYNRDLKAITDVYPHLKKNPERELRLAYTSLRSLNPQFAKDPLIGGTLLGQLLRQRDPLNPKSLRFDPGMATDLVRNRKDTRGGFAEMVPEAFRAGSQSALDYESVLGDRALKHEMQQHDRVFKREMQVGDQAFKRDHEREKEKARQEAEERKESRDETRKVRERVRVLEADRRQRRVKGPAYSASPSSSRLSDSAQVLGRHVSDALGGERLRSHSDPAGRRGYHSPKK